VLVAHVPQGRDAVPKLKADVIADGHGDGFTHAHVLVGFHTVDFGKLGRTTIVAADAISERSSQDRR
jgi:hypothetical protein